MSNRILTYLVPPQHRAQLRLDKLRAELEAIEQLAGRGVIEFWLPSADKVARKGIAKIDFRVFGKAKPAPMIGTADHVASELRRIARKLVRAARRIEAAKGGAL